MARITFPGGLQRHLPSPPMDVDGGTVAEALAAAFAREPRLRGYLLDDQGALRLHIAVFVDGVPIRDRTQLTDAIGPAARVDVVQALSGG